MRTFVQSLTCWPALASDTPDLSRAYAKLAFGISLVIFTLIELFDHQLLASSALHEHAIAFVAIGTAALAPLDISRWFGTCLLLAVFGTMLEQVEVVRTYSATWENWIGELLGIAMAAFLTLATRLLTNRLHGVVKVINLRRPSGASIDLALAGAGMLWLVVLFLD